MSHAKSKVGLIIATIYLLMVSAALIFGVINLTKSAFAGLYLVVLTAPWSFILTGLLDYFRVQDSVPIIIKFIFLLFFAFINAGLIYCIDHPLRAKNSDT
ncbi:MAG TPA: hypothetical protein VL197_09060 [Nitrospirota bacterium]|nr:hypothetical protein [Nitrospirota bacterium]